jgi:hypothetical protein
VFYFQTLLNQALSGIDGTGMIPTVVNIAYGILLVGFLIGLYQALMRGGDVRALGVTAIKYLVVAIIIANWSTIFRDVNNSFNSVAQFIGNSSGAGDVFLNWDKQLGQQFSDSSVSWWDIISGDIAALISVLLIVIAYIFYVISIVLFSFFYAMYGSVLYVLGPLVIALLPMAGVGQLAKSFATNVMIWNAWGIIYAIFGALITAIHVSQVSDGLQGFLGFFEGPADSIILGLISIFFAISIAVIPFIAKRIIAGDVGSAAATMVGAAANAAGIIVAAASGFAVGAGAAPAGAGASSSGAGTSAAAGSSGGSSTAVTSSSSAPPTPGVGESIRSGLASAMSSNSSPGASSGNSAAGEAGNGQRASSSGSSASGGARSGSGSRASGAGSSGSGSSGAANQPGFLYRPHGVVQSMAYHAAKAAGRAVSSNGPETA